MSEPCPTPYPPDARPPSLAQIPSANPQRALYRDSRCLHEMFEEEVALHPHSCAAFLDSESLTYGELNSRANQLARYLRECRVGPDTLVAVCMERSLNAIVALLGILKAGGAYVPLDPAYPAQRISYILSDSHSRLVITDRAAITRIPSGDTPLLMLDDAPPEIADFSGENLSPVATPHSLAYVIYTSGSTGRPKGVQVEHRNVVNFLHSMQKEPGIDDQDVVAAVTTFCFDIAGLEIHLPLATGASIALISREEASDGNKLRRRLEQSRITLMQATPATWRLLLHAGWGGDKNLRILCGGEAFPGDLAAELLPRCKSLWNMYGPTETTIWSSLCRVTKSEANIPIGLPIANTHFHIVDQNTQPVPIGAEGELLIGGDGVARGYLNRPDLTAEKFIADPFCGDGAARLYKTGDLARYLPDGNVAYLGRMDHQVKIRGYRIELGEIEFALATHPAVKHCVVTAREDLAGDEKRLIAYVVPSGNGKVQGSALREFVQRKLPDYMIPAIFVLLDNLPLTPNGKVDRKALPAPSRQNATLQRTYVPPRDASERDLTSLFEQVLKIKPIGITDNVFELGIDSLLAAQLFARIEKKFANQTLPHDPLFEAPTVEALAALLRGQNVPTRNWTSLVPIQPHGTETPLFCVHGAAGTVLGFYPLARRLAPSRPVYGLRNQGLFGRDLPHSTVEEMAAHYIKEMQTIQAHGPYLLAGWCFGAIVIFEMAQRLRRMGEEVQLLAMLNAPSTPEYAHLPEHTPDLAPLSLRTRRRWEEFRHLPVHRKLEFLIRKVSGQAAWRLRLMRFWAQRFALHSTRLIRLWLYDYYLRRRRPMPDFLRSRYFYMINGRAERQYRHQPYPGDVILFRDRGPYSDPNLGWGRFVRGKIKSYEMPVSVHDYRAMMQEPNVQRVAEIMEGYMATPTALQSRSA